MTTLLSELKMENLLRMLSWTLGCKGEVIEVGVYKGGALIRMAELVSGWHPEPRVYGFDTFEGILAPSLRDEDTPHLKGDFTCSLEEVKENVKLYKNIRLVKGIFPQDTPALPWIRFAHIDVDLFKPTLEAMTYVWPMIVDGGIMVIDDYGWTDTPGVKTAVDHFMDFHKLEDVPCPEWQVAFIKKETTWTTK